MSLSTRENQVQAREGMLIARETAVTEREARLLERESRIVVKEKWAAELHEREKLIHERERIIHDREQRLERLQLQRDDKMDIETFNAKHGNQSHWHRLTFSIRTISSITPSTTISGGSARRIGGSTKSSARCCRSAIGARWACICAAIFWAMRRSRRRRSSWSPAHATPLNITL